jgi:rhodanese-related sulfurtransferase
MPAVTTKLSSACSREAGFLSAEDRAKYFGTKIEAEWGPYDLKHALDERKDQVIVLDTRDAESFRKEHIPHAINIPTDELPGRLSELSRDKEIVPYCWSIVCHLATRAALFLSEKGYRVHELAGGIEYWKNAHLPLESK